MKIKNLAIALLVTAALSACAGPKNDASQVAWREYICEAEGGKYRTVRYQTDGRIRRCVDKSLKTINFPNGGDAMWPGY